MDVAITVQATHHVTLAATFTAATFAAEPQAAPKCFAEEMRLRDLTKPSQSRNGRRKRRR